MLPPGHIAAGFLAGKLASNFHAGIEKPEFLLLVSFFGFLPDIDFFLVFFKTRKFISNERINHRRFLTHAPFLYLLIFVISYLLFPNYHYLSWAFIIGTWSHFIIDTFSAEGILWLYPFSNKFYNKPLDPKIVITQTGFISHWLNFLKEYSKIFSFKAELVLILCALIILLY